MDDGLQGDILELLVNRKRLKAVDKANILDTPSEPVYDEITAKYAMK